MNNFKLRTLHLPTATVASADNVLISGENKKTWKLIFVYIENDLFA